MPVTTMRVPILMTVLKCYLSISLTMEKKPNEVQLSVADTWRYPESP